MLSKLVNSRKDIGGFFFLAENISLTIRLSWRNVLASSLHFFPLMVWISTSCHYLHLQVYRLWRYLKIHKITKILVFWSKFLQIQVVASIFSSLCAKQTLMREKKPHLIAIAELQRETMSHAFAFLALFSYNQTCFWAFGQLLDKCGGWWSAAQTASSTEVVTRQSGCTVWGLIYFDLLRQKEFE